MFAQVLRPPAVPGDDARLRMTVMASHSAAELARKAARSLADSARAIGLPAVQAASTTRAESRRPPSRDAAERSSPSMRTRGGAEPLRIAREHAFRPRASAVRSTRGLSPASAGPVRGCLATGTGTGVGKTVPDGGDRGCAGGRR